MKNVNIIKGSKDLHSRIPRGGITLLAQKYGVTSQYIISIVSGKVNNKPGIIEDAYRLVEFYEKKQEEIRSII
jgi:predicted transcriptional regulator